jgi:hypothetical protein
MTFSKAWSANRMFFHENEADETREAANLWKIATSRVGTRSQRNDVEFFIASFKVDTCKSLIENVFLQFLSRRGICFFTFSSPLFEPLLALLFMVSTFDPRYQISVG